MLTQLDLNTNMLQGTVPALIGKLTSLNYLDISYNSFSGYLPSGLCRLTALTDLYVCGSGNTGQGCGNLTGYPTCLSSLSAVEQLGNLPVYGALPSPTSSPSAGSVVQSVLRQSFFASGYGIAVIVVVVVVGVALMSCGVWVTIKYKDSVENASSLCGGGEDTRSFDGVVRSDDSSITTSPTLKQQEQQQAFVGV